MKQQKVSEMVLDLAGDFIGVGTTPEERKSNCSGGFGGLRKEGLAVESVSEILEDGQAVFAKG